MASPRRHALPPPRHRRTLSSTLVDESVAAAAALVEKWHPDDAKSASLFLHAADDAFRADVDYEPQRFLRAAADLHRAMLFFASDVTNPPNSQSGQGLVQAQALLQTAMRRLDLELQLLLDGHDTSNSKAIRAVAKAMMAAGYGKECISTFKSRRRAALATKLQYLLGFSPPPPPPPHHNFNFHKQQQQQQLTSWDQLDASIIPSWLATATVAFNSLFTAERHLCDAVFDDAAIGEAVLAAVANDQATGLLAVAEAVVARARRAPERLFRVLDVHDTLTEVMPALLSVFGDSSEVAARAAQVVAKVGEAARAILGSFEAAIQKDPSKATAAGGAVHPLTRYVMNYLVFLADYQEGLALLYDDGDEEEEAAAGASSTIIHRLVWALLGKLDAKAGCYREMALSYLFLANNTQYVANKAAGSGRLRGILGDVWAEEQSAKARAHVHVYVRAAWSKVMTEAQGHQPEAVEAAVMEAAAMQEQWVAVDEEMGEALRAAATAAVVPKYRIFYRRYGAAVRLTPGDVTAMIAALFGGPLPLASSSSGNRQRRCTEEVAQLQLQRRRHRQDDPNPNDPRRPQQLFT